MNFGGGLFSNPIFYGAMHATSRFGLNLLTGFWRLGTSGQCRSLCDKKGLMSIFQCGKQNTINHPQAININGWFVYHPEMVAWILSCDLGSHIIWLFLQRQRLRFRHHCLLRSIHRNVRLLLHRERRGVWLAGSWNLLAKSVVVRLLWIFCEIQMIQCWVCKLCPPKTLLIIPFFASGHHNKQFAKISWWFCTILLTWEEANQTTTCNVKGSWGSVFRLNIFQKPANCNPARAGHLSGWISIASPWCHCHDGYW